MTSAPRNLLDVRALLLTHLDNSPGPDDLDPGEVGIVGDTNHRGGYHCGSDRVVTNDYSVVESPRDRAGLTLAAAALDVGQFKVTTPKGTFDLPHYSRWLVAQCAAGTADTRDIREVIYSPDGKIVKRWDRLGKRTSGDSTHRWHTHESYFRDAIKAGRDLTAVKRRYLQSIGLLEDDDMTPEQAKQLAEVHKFTQTTGWADTVRLFTLLTGGKEARYTLPGDKEPRVEPNRLAESLAALSGKDFTNEPEIIAGVLRGLTPDMFAQAIRLAGVTPEAFAASLPEAFAHDLIVALGRQLSQ